MRVTYSPLNAVHDGENTIQIDRNSTSFSLNLGNNDVQESGMQVLDSTHYQCVHHYDSDEEDFPKETPPPTEVEVSDGNVTSPGKVTSGKDTSSGKGASAGKTTSSGKSTSSGKEGAPKGSWLDRFARDRAAPFQTPPPSMASASSSFSSPKEEPHSSLFTLFPNTSSLKPKRQLSYHAPIRYSHTMSGPLIPHALAAEGEKHCFAKFTNDVKHIVILVGVGLVGDTQGCPQNVANFLNQLQRHPVNTHMPDVTIVAPTEPTHGGVWVRA